MTVHIMKEIETRIPRKRLIALANLAERREGKRSTNGHLMLIFVSDKTMKRINTKFRHKPTTTDVLSFPLDAPYKRGTLIGEIYISVPKAIRQAKEYDVSVTNEIIRLFCHGLLHLYGHDHHKPAETRLMREQEAYLLERITPGVWSW